MFEFNGLIDTLVAVISRLWSHLVTFRLSFDADGALESQIVALSVVCKFCEHAPSAVVASKLLLETCVETNLVCTF